MSTSSESFCQRLDLGPNDRRRRLQLMGLTESIWPKSQILSVYVKKYEQEILDDFEAQLRDFKQIYHAVIPRFRLDEMHALIEKQIRNLGHEIHTEEYFEERLRLGSAYGKAELPAFVCNYLFHLLSNCLLASLNNHQQQDLDAVAERLLCLDLSLALEVIALMERRSRKERSSDRKTPIESDNAALYPLPKVEKGYVLTVLEQVLSPDTQNLSPMSVVVAEVDRLAIINQTHGQAIGDEVLRRVSVRMRSALRDEDTVGRYGGDDFLILLRDAPLDMARDVAERLRRRVAAEPIRLRDQQIHPTITVGVVQAGSSEGAELLFRRARSALEAAIEAGRNCVRCS
ncbi:MAG: GGDEF domain-containing protein [Myxococcales bacterium]|nr:MAG: GGDEF domain-containing protein [Myxococcales bacterium]